MGTREERLEDRRSEETPGPDADDRTETDRRQTGHIEADRTEADRRETERLEGDRSEAERRETERVDADRAEADESRETSEARHDERATAFEHGRRVGRREGAARTLAQTFCLVTGLLLIAAGVLGFIFGGTSFETGDSVGGEEFVVFDVNGWHNLLHIVTGTFLVLMSPGIATAIAGSLIFGLVYAGITVWGILGDNTIADAIPIDSADNVLHAVLAVVALLVAFVASGFGLSARRQRRTLEPG